MTLEFETKQIETQPILGVRTSATKENLGQVMGPLFGEVYGHIQHSGQTPVGMPFSVYYSMEGNSVDLQCGMPVAQTIEGAGRIEAGALPGGTVATVTHMGPYDSLPSRRGRR